MFCFSATMLWETSLAFPLKKHSFCIVDSYMQFNNIKGKYCCVFIATMATRTHHIVTLYVHNLPC